MEQQENFLGDLLKDKKVTLMSKEGETFEVDSVLALPRKSYAALNNVNSFIKEQSDFSVKLKGNYASMTNEDYEYSKKLNDNFLDAIENFVESMDSDYPGFAEFAKRASTFEISYYITFMCKDANPGAAELIESKVNFTKQ